MVPARNRIGYKTGTLLAILAGMALFMSSCLPLLVLNEVDCAVSGGVGYRMSRSEVTLATCGDYLQGLVQCTVDRADPKTFRSMGKVGGKYWGADATRAYSNCQSISGVDPQGFQRPNRLRGSRFFRAGDYVLWEANLLPDADSDSFQALSEQYGSDKNAAWFVTKKIQGAEGESFEVVRDEWNTHFAKDAHRVYRADKILADATPEFSVLVDQGRSSDLYFSDGLSVFDQRGKILPMSDPGTFEDYLRSYYSKDSSQVYYKDRVLLQADPATFTLYDSDRAWDLSHVWFEGMLVPGADPKSFHLAFKLGENIGEIEVWADNHDSYIFDQALRTGPSLRGERLAGDHAMNGYFEINDYIVYCEFAPSHLGGPCCFSLSGLLASRVTMTHSAYIAGSDAVYFGGRRLSGVDAATFAAASSRRLRGAAARDASNYYWRGVPIVGVDVPGDLDLESFKTRGTEDGSGGFTLFCGNDGRWVECAQAPPPICRGQ